MDRAPSSVLSLQDTPVVQHNTSSSNIQSARDQFAAFLEPANILSDDSACQSRSGSPWSPALESQAPQLVVRPGTTEQVSSILKICSAQRIPVYAYSGGTGLGGTTVATRRGVCIDLVRMDGILDLHQEDMDIAVQPAVGWQELNEYLAPKGLFFPPDPAPGAKIGGMIAMSCSRTNAYRYGTMKEWVISLTVVLADGSIVKTRNRPRKSSAGYDLAHLIIGAEGTLGIVTEAILKLTVAPMNLHVGIAIFPSTESAVTTAIQIINSGHLLDALEFVDEHSIHALNRSKLSTIAWSEEPTLFLKLAGSTNTIADLKHLVETLAHRNNATYLSISSEESHVTRWWHARKMVARAFMSMKNSPTDVFIPADAAVPICQLAASIAATHKASQDLGFFCSTIGHIGDGNVHTAVLCSAEQKGAGDGLIKYVQEMALRLDGTISGEHGVGLGLRDMLVKEVGETGVDLMRKVKFALDPHCVLNPDKVFRVNLQD